jgi:fluoroacetyl-CoA thioesterase
MSQKSRTGEATLRLSPLVLATSQMVELMELAAARLMKTHLAEGETSVSIEMKVTHVAPNAGGGTLRAVAAYGGVCGRLHRFKINVFDESGLIGSAEHTRAVVVERRLLALARRRAGKASALLMV